MLLEIKNSTKNSLPFGKLFFVSIAQEILGKNYELSLVFLGDKKAKDLNIKYRNKNYVPNILSFPIDEQSGEIFINLNKCKKEFLKYNLSYKNYLIFLFIHGCLHLKGLDHGSKMENLEQKYLKKFKK
jgi:probable rRNA maturation factor